MAVSDFRSFGMTEIRQTVSVIDDPEQCYRAVCSRDSRFDGWFVTAVHTTGIYCRPSCPAITPKRANVSFFAVRGCGAAQRLPGVQALPARRHARVRRSGTCAPMSSAGRCG